MDLKKEFLTWAIVLLLVIAGIAIFDNLRTSRLAAELQADRDGAAEKVSSLQVELENTLSEADELREEQKRLEEVVGDLEQKNSAMKSPVRYQDFKEAISAVEKYKSVDTFEDAIKFIALVNFTGFSTLDSEGTCPCSFSFVNRSIEWKPNVITDLKEFTLEEGKIALTYQTTAKLRHDYQLIMTKAAGYLDQTES
ncbi:hypothetical protein [Mesobacillus subterraneus]|uniref:Uncharacterized protein n=1 Tax=Mesobacillus subterraneus TaxID=285983 RepID=A0A3R9E8J9_9BACI|nr:hypothetical protein [Mesobacillus subterraneus]RSD28417.1 hypothetical protein EJA10_04850 [Mesobacillus subterraneus]